VRWLTGVYGPVIYQKLAWVYSGFSTMFWKLFPRVFDKYKAWIFEILGQKIHSKVVRN
jgi:hypothetical protein